MMCRTSPRSRRVHASRGIASVPRCSDSRYTPRILASCARSPSRSPIISARVTTTDAVSMGTESRAGSSTSGPMSRSAAGKARRDPRRRRACRRDSASAPDPASAVRPRAGRAAPTGARRRSAPRARQRLSPRRQGARPRTRGGRSAPVTRSDPRAFRRTSVASSSFASRFRSARRIFGPSQVRNRISPRSPKPYVIASPSGAWARRVAFSASGIGSSAIALNPVPSAADCVMPPDSTPTASPSSNPNAADTPITVARPLTATMSARAICGSASFFRLPKNWGPTE